MHYESDNRTEAFDLEAAAKRDVRVVDNVVAAMTRSDLVPGLGISPTPISDRGGRGEATAL